MSLINDALKKAQKQRTGDGPDLSAMPAIGGESATRIARREKPAGFNTLILWIGIGGTVLLVLLIGGFFAVRWMIRPPEPKAAPTPPTTVTANTTPAATAPVLPTVSTNPPSASNSTAAATTATIPTVSSPTPAVIETKPVVIAVPPPEPAPPKPVLPAPKMESKAIAYIEALRVAGIRASTTDSKVLMNDRVYRIGDTIEHNLGLKLAVINANALTFEDEKGARYTRNF